MTTQTAQQNNTIQINQQQINQQQYQDKSTAYLNSSVHAQGVEFDKIQFLLLKHHYQHVLDLGCGGGHVTYHTAPLVQEVTAYDLTQEMVDLVLAQCKQRGFDNVIGVTGSAEALPFPPAQFDCIISRFSAHHWQNLTQALLNIHRTLKKNGRVIFIDIVGSDNPIIDTFLQTVERIRDPSHVRNYALSEWAYLAESSGFAIESIEKQTLALDFTSWVNRMQTVEASIQTIRHLQQQASSQTKSYFNIQADGSFTTEVMVMVLTPV